MQRDIIFKTRLAAKLLVYFLVLSILPILVFGFISNNQMVRQSAEVHDRYSFKSAEMLNMFYLGRLKQLSDAFLQEIRYIDLSHAPDALGLSLQVATDFFSDLELIPWNYAMMREDEAAHVRLGRVIIRSVRDSDQTARLVMLAMTRDGNVLAGTIKPLALWGQSDEMFIPRDAKLQIYTPGGKLLINSAPDGDILPDSILAEILGHSRGSMALEIGGASEKIYYRELFLEGEFVFPRWTLVLRQPLGTIAISQTPYISLFPLIVVLCSGLVLYSTLVIIRRTMTPLNELKGMAQRISRRDFDARVNITSGDEIEELGQTLNKMAGQLKIHFSNMEAQTTIDRKILSSMDVDSVVDSTLTHLRVSFGAESATLMLWDRGVFRVFILNRSVGTSVTTISIEEKILLKLWGRIHNSGWINASQVPELNLFSLKYPLNNSLVCQIPMHGVPVGIAIISMKDILSFDETCMQLTGRTLNQIAVAFANIRLFRELQEFNWGTLEALARAVDEKSAWTQGHSNRVAALAIDMAENMGWTEDQLDKLHRAALLHDLGKIGIPTEILDKPGRLDDAEFALIRTHPDRGARILEPVRAYAEVIPMIRHHHEKYDGSGYPSGLVGKDIPEGARILAVADVYDALITSRPYREGWSLEKVYAFLEDNSGVHFDPEVVKVFLKM